MSGSRTKKLKLKYYMVCTVPYKEGSCGLSVELNL
jgi:hypothetical protein